MAFSYKAKTFRTTAFFPLFQHTAFYFPPSGEPDYQIVQTIKPEACELPFRLKELRTFTCFHVSQHINMSWRSWSVRANGSQVGMSPIGSYVGGLTSKGQVGVLFWEHRGWILRMASLIKVEKQHSPSFLLIHIDDSTFHHSLKRMVPLSLQNGKRAACFPFVALLNSYLYTREHSALFL